MQYIIAMFYCAQNFMSVLVIYYEFHSDGSEVYSNIRYTMIMFNPNLRIGIQLHRNQTLKLSTHYLHLQVNVCLLKALWLQITFKFELRDQIISIFISGPPFSLIVLDLLFQLISIRILRTLTSTREEIISTQ